jgi:hypothetical protein
VFIKSIALTLVGLGVGRSNGCDRHQANSGTL